MKGLQTVVNKEAKALDIQFIRDRIRDLPKILRTIENNDGGRTKYWDDIFTLYVFDIFKKSIFSLAHMLNHFAIRYIKIKKIWYSGR